MENFNNRTIRDSFIDNERIKYVDIDELEYPKSVLVFLRKKLDEFTIDCFRKVTNHHNKGGLHKTKIEDYETNRKKYDNAFLTLEVQGFIEKKQNGTFKPYFLTVRGFQLIHLLQEEKKLSKKGSE